MTEPVQLQDTAVTWRPLSTALGCWSRWRQETCKHTKSFVTGHSRHFLKLQIWKRDASQFTPRLCSGGWRKPSLREGGSTQVRWWENFTKICDLRSGYRFDFNSRCHISIIPIFQFAPAYPMIVIFPVDLEAIEGMTPGIPEQLFEHVSLDTLQELLQACCFWFQACWLEQRPGCPLQLLRLSTGGGSRHSLDLRLRAVHCFSLTASLKETANTDHFHKSNQTLDCPWIQQQYDRDKHSTYYGRGLGPLWGTFFFPTAALILCRDILYVEGQLIFMNIK